MEEDLLIDADDKGERVANLDILCHEPLGCVSVEDAHAGARHGCGGGEGRCPQVAGEGVGELS